MLGTNTYSKQQPFLKGLWGHAGPDGNKLQCFAHGNNLQEPQFSVVIREAGRKGKFMGMRNFPGTHRTKIIRSFQIMLKKSPPQTLQGFSR